MPKENIINCPDLIKIAKALGNQSFRNSFWESLSLNAFCETDLEYLLYVLRELEIGNGQVLKPESFFRQKADQLFVEYWSNDSL